MKILIEESVLRQALEALGYSSDFLFNYHDDIDPNAEREMQAYQSVQNRTYKAITALRTALDAAEKVDDQLNKARSDALREAAENVDSCGYISVEHLNRMADSIENATEMEKGEMTYA